MVNSSSEYPACFSAVLFDKVSDPLVRTKKEHIKALKANKEELLSTWRLLTERDEEKN